MTKFIALFLVFFSLNVNASSVVKEACDTSAGMSDSNVLALSLQSGFCQTYGYEIGKPECLNLPKDSRQVKHFSLHGLWPNQNACGQNYGFCGVPQKGSHCAYSPVVLSPDVADNLKKIMPGYRYGSCLERHEWNKHGSCQILSSDDYFSLAMRLVIEADETIFGHYLTEHNGETISLAALREKIAQAFGKKNSGKIYLGCKNGILVDIYVQLPALILFDESLEALIDKAPVYQYRDTCPKNILISNFNKESTYSLAEHDRVYA